MISKHTFLIYDRREHVHSTVASTSVCSLHSVAVINKETGKGAIFMGWVPNANFRIFVTVADSF